MTSGGDPTIERKPALTTTTPIRKRKSDSGGGLAVLVALLFVVVAAGYYFLTQTGTLTFDKDEEVAPATASSGDEEPSRAAVETETEEKTIQQSSAASDEPATSGNTDPKAETAGKIQGTAEQVEDVTADSLPTPAIGEPAVASNDADVPAAPSVSEVTAEAASPPEIAPVDRAVEAAEADSATADQAGADNSASAKQVVAVEVEASDSKIRTTMAKAETSSEEDVVAAAPLELTAATLVEIEELLVRLQIDPGPADGVIDNQAATAIRLYQEIAGLPVDGKASPELLVELREVVELLSNE